MRDAHSGFAILSEVRAPWIWYTSVKGDYHAKKYLEAIVKAQEMRAQVWQLNNLTDAELRDIGINRCDIMRTVYDHYA
jgi:uncharacterized protein YjiS (DUF1127 family)